MITRKRCEQIADDWVIEQACAEQKRRMDSVLQRYQKQHLHELSIHSSRALLAGMYDPPCPHIPSLFARLFMNDWTPPEVDWPMKTKPHD